MLTYWNGKKFTIAGNDGKHSKYFIGFHEVTSYKTLFKTRCVIIKTRRCQFDTLFIWLNKCNHIDSGREGMKSKLKLSVLL